VPDDQAERLRHLVQQHREGTAQYEYPADLREEVARWARQRQEDGATWKQLSAGVGVSPTAIRNWVRRLPPEAVSPVGRSERSGFLPVVIPKNDDCVALPRPAPLVIVSPTGFRLEGLGFDDAVRAMRSLS